MNELLPGIAIYKISPTYLNVGDKVYDQETKTTGIISSIRETSPEWIEVFITLKDSKEEKKAIQLKSCVFLDHKSKKKS